MNPQTYEIRIPIRKFSIDAGCINGIAIESFDLALIQLFENTRIISLPVYFNQPTYYDVPFTTRIDSPETSLRLVESRAYASIGADIEPFQTIAQTRGSITQDNVRYLRYSGEIHIMKVDLPPDNRVNVIGHVHPDYLPLLNFIPNGAKIQFVTPKH